jgi:hypothetical protein
VPVPVAGLYQRRARSLGSSARGREDDPGKPRRRLSFPPLSADHVAVDGGCPLCPAHLGNGQRVVQLAVGPTDRDAARSHEAGEEYAAGAVLAHEPCAKRFSDAELEIALSGLDFLHPESPGTSEGAGTGSFAGVLR